MLHPKVGLFSGMAIYILTQQAAREGLGWREYSGTAMTERERNEVFPSNCFIASSTLNTLLVSIKDKGLMLTSVSVLTAIKGHISAVIEVHLFLSTLFNPSIHVSKIIPLHQIKYGFLIQLAFCLELWWS